MPEPCYRCGCLAEKPAFIWWDRDDLTGELIERGPICDLCLDVVRERLAELERSNK